MAGIHKTYWFPSQTGSYVTSSGSLRFKLWTDSVPDTNININAHCHNVKPINIPLEVDSGNSKFRFASTKITFKYHTDIETMLSWFDSEDYTDQIFLDIIMDGSLYWRGILNWASIRKSDYYIESGTLKYKNITFGFVDAMAYLWKNNKTLNDASYTDGIIIGTLLDNIFALIGFSGGDVSIDSNLEIDEDCGNSYNLDALKITGLSTATSCIEFLKTFMLDFGCFIYILKGKVYVVLRNGGSTLSIADSNIMKLDKIDNQNVIGYVNVYAAVVVGDGMPVASMDFSVEQGTKNTDKTNLNYDREHTYLKKVYTDGDGSTYQPGDKKPSGGDTDNLIDSEASFLVNEIETGDVLFYNKDGGDNDRSMVRDGITETNVSFYDIGVDVNTALEYWIEMGFGVTIHPRYKVELLIALIGNVYIDFFLTAAHIFKVQLKDISAYDDLSKRFVLDGGYHRARNASIDLLADKISMELVKVT